MSHEFIRIKHLFTLSKDAIIGIENGTIVFANPASSAYFPDCVGKQAEEFVPAHVLCETSETFVASVVINNISGSVSASRLDNMLILSFSFQSLPKSSFSSLISNITASLGSSMATMRMAADQIAKYSSAALANPKLQEYFSIFYHNYYSLLKVTQHLSLLSSISDGTISFDPRQNDLVTLCSEITDSAAHFVADRNVKIIFSSPLSKAPAFVDSDKIEQLILNLLSNSLLHTSPGDSITIRLNSLNDKYVISVDDTGSGIPPHILSGIFTQYNREMTLAQLSEGAGMGLAIAKGIAQLHDGALVIESREGEGTSVRIMLPSNLKPSDRFRQAQMPYNASGPKNILIELSDVLSHEIYTSDYLG